MSYPFLPLFALLLTLSPSAPVEPTQPGTGTGTSGILLVCPDTAKLFCGASIDPEDTGEATATTDCPISPNVTITHSDAPGAPQTCPADRFHAIILRTWTATDACGNQASCIQEIHILRQIWNLDIQPGTCPNSIDTNSGPSTVTLAIPGAAGQNVAAIVPSSVRVYTEGCAQGPVAPTHTSMTDITRPYVGLTPCGCQSLGADGLLDLRLDFDRAALVNGLNLGAVPAGSQTRFVVTGTLVDGCTFLAVDCVTVTHNVSFEGCSLGYWKNHTAAWGPTGFHTTDDFDTIFGVNAFTPNRTLLQALQAGGGGINNLGRQGTAALLSASHPGIHFPLTMAQVITMVHDAVVNGTVDATAQQLDTLVNAGCPLN